MKQELRVNMAAASNIRDKNPPLRTRIISDFAEWVLLRRGQSSGVAALTLP